VAIDLFVKSEQELDRSIFSFPWIFLRSPRRKRPRYETRHPATSRAFYPARVVLNCRNMSSAQKKTEPQLNFEGAMDRLEEIVEQMESGKMMLEELIVRYEEGMKLVKICQERLTSAEQRIEIITRNNAGKPVVKNFEPAAEKEPAARPEEKGANKNDDVSLF
jgi:exodeoxyribonuclease VII small subunit